MRRGALSLNHDVTRCTSHEADGVHPTATVAAFQKVCKKRGFKFMGETTTLSFLQAMGGVNHHKHDCFAYAEAEKRYSKLADAWK